jgi:cyclohexanone monooxygenase
MTQQTDVPGALPLTPGCLDRDPAAGHAEPAGPRADGAVRAHRAYLFYKAAFIAAEVSDPAVRAAVTPGYPWGCKRVILASTFYAALNAANVQLVPHPVTSVTRTGLVDDTGTEYPVDVLVMSTGFQPTSFLATLDVHGAGGVSLRKAWASRQSAYLGITVAGFPNFFILYGPNTNGAGSIIAQLERQAEFTARAVRRLESGRWRYIDTDPAAQHRYVTWLDRQLAAHASAMNSGCTNYYHDSGGANITQWPSSHLRYLLTVRALGLRGLSAPPTRAVHPAHPAEAGRRRGGGEPVKGAR